MFLRLVALCFVLSICSTPATAQFFRNGNRDMTAGTVAGDLNLLEDATRQTSVAFDTHLESRRNQITKVETRLNLLLVALRGDAATLRQQVNGNSDPEDVYRTFHLVEYGLANAWGYANEIGYGRSLEPYFVGISNHVESLARQGLRNPRVQKPSLSGGYSTRNGRRSEVPTIPPPNEIRPDQERRSDAGNFFRRLFR
ncbi:hypothetical protein [Prosthecobacter sp.]|uniref:hypothetical protein n=1 Tax=Prosthecobacter sp. TaxID=1965333 RepID=UPI001D8AE684|nr:hypothetical protein [Prosthecobacter sp.]MCB1279217.1 hypothetical protein [Prosthecobacter sp.]